MLSRLSVALAVAPPAEDPAPSADDLSIVQWVAARPEGCNISVAKKVTLDALLRRPDHWVGECVAVSGYWYGRALFKSPTGARQRDSQSSDELEGYRVGIYGRPEDVEATPDRPKRFVAVGIANTCERLWDGAIMVMGYCHYTGGPIIAVAEMRPR